MRLFLFALALLFVTPLPAKAQDQATVVASCGSVTLTAGTQHFRTIDTNGVTCSAGGGGAAPTSVWSSSDATANGMTLSNGGLTANITAASLHNVWQILRGSISKTSGKLYVEFSTSTGQTLTFHVGLASAGVNINDYLGNSNYSAGINLLAGATFVSAGFVGTASFGTNPVNSNDVLALAVDFATGNVWAARNNVWVNTGVPGAEVNPTAGTNPVVAFTPTTVGALFPAMGFSTGGSNAVWTLQPTAAALKYAPPSGFKAWDAP